MEKSSLDAEVRFSSCDHDEIIMIFHCVACDCGGRSDECIFDSEAYLLSGNRTGGICTNCENDTFGNACQKCAEGFYPTNSFAEELNCAGIA